MSLKPDFAICRHHTSSRSSLCLYKLESAREFCKRRMALWNTAWKESAERHQQNWSNERASSHVVASLLGIESSYRTKLVCMHYSSLLKEKKIYNVKEKSSRDKAQLSWEEWSPAIPASCSVQKLTCNFSKNCNNVYGHYSIMVQSKRTKCSHSIIILI